MAIVLKISYFGCILFIIGLEKEPRKPWSLGFVQNDYDDSENVEKVLQS